MKLSEAEGNNLRNEWESIESSAIMLEHSKRVYIESYKKRIILFCIENGIELYNIAQLKTYPTATNVLNHLLKIISTYDDPKYNQGDLETWKDAFTEELAKVKDDARNLHGNADISVGSQYIRTGKYKEDTLLTLKDMQDLLDSKTFQCAHILKSQPFSLTESSKEQDDEIIRLIERGVKTNKYVFLPINHEGHWTYLYGKDDSWTISDSQPFDRGELTHRQNSIKETSRAFLSSLTRNDINIEYITTGLQSNNYECGTHVVNGYRKMAQVSYTALSHDDILRELVDKQFYNDHQDYGLPDPDQAHHPENTNYNFLLKAGEVLCKTLSLAALSLVILAIVGVINVPTFGIGGIAVAGIATAGLVSYGFFKPNNAVSPDTPKEGAHLLL
jgi:hypothetical protein